MNLIFSLWAALLLSPCPVSVKESFGKPMLGSSLETCRGKVVFMCLDSHLHSPRMPLPLRLQLTRYVECQPASFPCLHRQAYHCIFYISFVSAQPARLAHGGFGDSIHEHVVVSKLFCTPE